jgi:hypothetical protein
MYFGWLYLKFLVAMFGSTFALGPSGPEEKGGKN